MKIIKSDNILVTGGAGFIGSNIIRRLNKMGIGSRITVCDRLNEKSQRNLVGLKFHSIVSPERVFNLPAYGPDIIIHMGATSSTNAGFSECFENNYEFSKELFCFAKGNPFIYASSAATYANGQCDDTIPLKDLRPKSNYAISKHFFDQYVENCSNCLGLKFFNVFGPGEWAKGDMASYILNQTLRAIREKKQLSVYEVGVRTNICRDFVPIDYAIDKMFALVEKDARGLFNIGTGCELSFTYVAQIIAVELGRIARTKVDVLTDKKDPSFFGNGYQYYTKSVNEKIDSVIGGGNLSCGDTTELIEQSIRDYVGYILRNYKYYLD